MELSQRLVKIESKSGSGAGYRFGGPTIKLSLLVLGFCYIVSIFLPFVLCCRPFCYVTLGQQEAKTSNAGESKKQFPKPFQRLREGLRAQGLRKLTGGVREASGVL